MKPQHETTALTIAATLLKQVRRVLQHSGDHMGSTIKMQVERILHGVPADLAAPEPDDQAFFGAIAATHGEEFASVAREGDPQPEAPGAAREKALQDELADLKKRLADLESK